MSVFREWLAAIERRTGRSAVSIAVLAEDPGPALLSWELARVAVITPECTEVDGQLYGTPFRVMFPPRGLQPSGHVWALATWAPHTSGTGRPEARAVCRTCAHANGWPVSAMACLAEAVGVRGVEGKRPDRHLGGVEVVPEDRAHGHWAGSFDVGWTPCACWVGRHHSPWPKDLEKCSNPACPSVSGHSGPCPPSDWGQS